MLTVYGLAIVLGLGGAVAVALDHDLSALALWGAFCTILTTGVLS
jgi:hypothetical protein